MLYGTEFKKNAKGDLIASYTPIPDDKVGMYYAESPAIIKNIGNIAIVELEAYEVPFTFAEWNGVNMVFTSGVTLTSTTNKLKFTDSLGDEHQVAIREAGGNYRYAVESDIVTSNSYLLSLWAESKFFVIESVTPVNGGVRIKGDE